MKLLPPALLLVGGTLYIGMLLAAKGSMFPNKQPLEPLRNRIEFCSLLQQEIKLDHTAGLITQERAEEIITSCFNTY